MKKLPKVLVGAPVSDNHEYATDKYLEAIKNFTYRNYDIFLIDNSAKSDFYKKLKKLGIPIIRKHYMYKSVRKKMVECRNLLRKKVLDEGYDYFFNIDQDVLPPKDAIERFLKGKKDVLTGIYYNVFTWPDGKRVLLPIAYTWFSEKEQKSIMDNLEEIKKMNPGFYRKLEKENFSFKNMRRQLTHPEVEEEKLLKIKSCGSGCMFISKKVLKKLKFRENPEGGFDDMTFCIDLIKNKIDLYADTSMKCGHVTKARDWKWDLRDHKQEIKK